jgi:hypothetical protein
MVNTGDQMLEENGISSEEAVDIEAIMAEIRVQIQEKRNAATVDASPGFGGPLPAEFYEALIKAEQATAHLQPKMVLTDSSLPIIGPLVNRFRYNFHELVLFYVNNLASNQIQFNTQVIRALTLLSEDVADSRESES